MDETREPKKRYREPIAMKLPTVAELADYKALTRAELQDLAEQLSRSPHLFAFLKTAWAEAVGGNIDRMETNLKIDNAAYHLFRIFRDELGLMHEIEDGLALIEPLARAGRKTVSFRETPLRLPTEEMDQINQIESAIFEIAILRGLIRACSGAGIKIDLYPRVGNGGSNVEARLWIDGRWCYIEAKALGYTKNMPGANGARVGSMSIESMTAPITRALDEKTSKGKQLGAVPDGEAAVLLLAQKGFIDRQIANSTARDFMASKPTPLSAVLMFGSAFCRTAPDLVTSPAESSPLTDKETAFFQQLHRHHGFNQADYLRVANRVLEVAKASVTACGARPQTSLHERVSLFLIAKAVTTFESIVRLYELGHDLDAQILARSLLEAFAKARYIHGNAAPEAAAKEFIDFMVKKTAKVFNRVEGYTDPFYKDFLERVDPEKTMRAKKTNAPCWPENVTDVFKAIESAPGIGTLPREFYDLLSDLVHSNARVIPDYLDSKNDFSPFLLRPEARSSQNQVLHTLCAITMMAVELLLETFGQPKPPENHELFSALGALPPAPTTR